MTRNGIPTMIVGGLAVAMALSMVALGQAPVLLRFTDMDPHLGQRLALRVVEPSGREVARMAVPVIPAPRFEVELPGLEPGAPYRIDLYADANGNGSYDPPPDDHAYRIEIPALEEGEPITFAHHTDFVDIRWPPGLDGTIGETEYDGTMTDAGTGMGVHWQHDGSLLYVGLTAPGTGWLSIGFEPTNRMQGANIVIGAIVDGEVTIEDHYGNAPVSHRADDVDHIIQAAGREVDGESILEFAIPLDSGDDQDKLLSAGRELTIILAYHRTSDRLTARHTARSTASLHLGE